MMVDPGPFALLFHFLFFRGKGSRFCLFSLKFNLHVSFLVPQVFVFGFLSRVTASISHACFRQVVVVVVVLLIPFKNVHR